MDLSLIIEILAVLAGLLYVILLIKQRIGCWLAAIIGSCLSIYLFIDNKLYSEAILYGYYVGISIYGWILWSKPKKKLPIRRWTFFQHGFWFCIGIISSFSLGYFFAFFTDAELPYLDAFTTVFSFIANYMEVHKVISAWIVWIVINLVTIGMYSVKSLDYYALLMAVYAILSVIGYIQWKKELNNVYKKI